jgi:thioredoxin-related protein
MKIDIISPIFIAALLCITAPACSPGSDSQDTPQSKPGVQAKNDTGVTWVGYDEGMAMGKEAGKKIIINFYADWCGYCNKMNREIFSKGEAADFINQNFVPIRINTDVETQLAEKYRVSGLPTTWFLDKDGEGIMNIPGYLPKEMFLSYMKFIQTDSHKTMSFKQFMGVE